MVGIKQGTCDAHRVFCITEESLHSTLETEITLCAN